MTAANQAFPAFHHALDFQNLCAKWCPTDVNGAIWDVQAALPYVKSSVWAFTNGYSNWVTQCELTLQGGLKPAMQQALGEVYTSLVAASQKAATLERTFVKVYADDINRANTRGGRTLNTR